MDSEKRIPIPEYIEAEYRKLEAIGWIDTPLEIVRNAKESFIFNCLLADGIGHKLITPANFRPEIPIHTGGPGLTIRKTLTQKDLDAAKWNNALLALGATALAVDKALDATFGGKNPEDASLLGSLRAIIYQIRHAFAHDLFNPMWLIKSKYRRVYTVTIETADVNGQKAVLPIRFDGAALDGKRVKPEDYGGLEGYAMLLNCCEGLVAREPRGMLRYVPVTDQ